MANCCGTLLNCDELVTIQYMRDLVNASRVSQCVTVNGGQIPIGSCCEVASNEYIPRYGELSGLTSTIAPIRVEDSNPENDRNGFKYTLDSHATSDCCDGDITVNANLKKSEISFNTTSAISDVHTIVKEPIHCDLNYQVKETKKWQRDSYSCKSDGTILITSTDVSGETTHSDTMRRNVSSSSTSSDYYWDITFDDVDVTTSISADCSNSYSDSTQFTLEGYQLRVNVDLPSAILCEEQSYTAATVYSGECSNEITLTAIWEIDNQTTEIVVGNTTSESVPLVISATRNEHKQLETYITISATVYGQTVEIVPRTKIDRMPCEWTPTPSSSDGCSVYTVDGWQWNHENEEEHPY